MKRTAALPTAVVVGLDSITGLQTARILARHGIPVIGVADDARHHCTRTRVVDRVIEVDTTGGALIDALVELGPRLGHRAVLVPCRDLSVLVLARQRERLQEWYHLALSPTAVVELLMDKLSFAGFAAQLGLPLPATRTLSSRADAERAAAELPFPCVVKPKLHSPVFNQRSRAKAHRVETAAELLDLYDRYAVYAAGPLIAQQWIEGPDSELYSCNCYFDRTGQPLVTFVARKLRQWPPQAGVSCLGEECRNDEVLELTLRLFRAVSYHGLGYVEVKRDVRTGKHYIIEPNIGRPTGRSAIAEAGGVELLFTMYCDVLGLPLPDARVQRYGGARWIYWRNDARSAFYYWRRGELTLRQWAASWRGRMAEAVFSWRDPLPFITDVFSFAARTPGRRTGVSVIGRPDPAPGIGR
jgi:predicted ATP-grasp superfamily ATP-dependent carboligase